MDLNTKKNRRSCDFFFSQLFCDFGEEFEVLDWDGETPETAIVHNISKVARAMQPLSCQHVLPKTETRQCG